MRSAVSLPTVVLFLALWTCPSDAVNFGKINRNTWRLFLQQVDSGRNAFFPVHDELCATFPLSPGLSTTSLDSFLYVGYYDPHETLLIEDTSCYFACNIAVVQEGVLIVRNSLLRVYGGIVAAQCGNIIFDSSEVQLMSSYAWQFTIAALDSAEIRITDSEFNYNGYPGYTFIKDNASLYVENSEYRATTALFTENARVTFINVTGGGEYSARDSSVVYFKNVGFAVIHLQVPESSSVYMDFGTDTFEFVDHWEVTPSSPFVSGTGYTFIIDSSNCVFNPSCASFSDLTLEDSQCDLLVRFTGDVRDTISGLVNWTHYDDWLAPFGDRTIHLINTTITCWHMQMFATSRIWLESSIIGEFICFDSSEAHLTNSIHTGTGGPLTAATNSEVSASYSDIRANTVKVKNKGLLVLNVCTVWGDVVVSDSALAVLLGTLNPNPIRVFDAGAAVVAAVKSPVSAVVGEDVAIVGDAYIVRTSASPYDFGAYRLYYLFYPIDTVLTDSDSLEWTPITDWNHHQVVDDTLCVWNTSGLSAGRYFIKLDWREASTDSVVSTYFMINLREEVLVEEETRHKRLSVNVHPNPFNSSTRIDYCLPTDAYVTLEIYDVYGRVVRVLAEGKQPAGQHSVIWDRKDEGHDIVSSGVYLCRLRSNGFQITRKMLVLK